MLRRSPRVLVFGLNYPPEPTGISPYTGAMTRGLTARGYEVKVLTARPHYPEWRVRPGYRQWTRREVINGLTLARLRHYVPRRPTGIRRALSEVTFGLRQATQPWGRQDILLAVSPALISTAIVRLRAIITRNHTPFVVWVQDLYSLGLAETSDAGGLVIRAITTIEGWVLRRASRVVVIHERFAARVHQDFGVPLDRIDVIRNWTHLPPAKPIDRAAARDMFGWTPDEAIVLHAGNMGVKQGLTNVIEAARLAERDGAHVRFVLMGGGSERDRLQNLAGDTRAVTFLDSLPDHEFAAALEAADVLLVNEKAGVAEMAVPSKLTSYFSAGRPVLAATSLSGITAEEVRQAGAGLVVPAGDPRALLDGALSLMSDTATARALGASGKQFRDTVLSESAALAAFDTLLAKLIADDEHRLDGAVINCKSDDHARSTGRFE